jgi:DNA-binding NarL/FixJ family response regulator
MKDTKAVAIINYKAISENDVTLVQMMADGMIGCEISVHFKVSDRTVESWTSKLRKSLGVKNSYGLIALFFRQGLIK